MIRSLLAFFLQTYKSSAQIQLENLFLQKQLMIALRSSPKLRSQRLNKLFFSVMADLAAAWKDALLASKIRALRSALIGSATPSQASQKHSQFH